MGNKNPGVITPRNCDSTVRQAIQQLATKVIGLESTPSFAGLTVFGLTASSLLQTDASKVLESIAMPLVVSKGGSGAATLTNHGILLGSGVDAVTPLGVAGNGQLPIGSAGADPVLAGLTGTENQVNVANAAGSITLSTPQDIHIGAAPTFDDLTISTPVNIYALSHDSFTDYDTNEHIDHTSVTLTAGTGLTGGGDISANRTFAVDEVLQDLDTLGVAASDGQFIVATAVGTFAYESGNTARTSLGLGTGDSPTFADLVIANGGTVGQAAGPLLTFDDTNNYLEISGCKVTIGTAVTPSTHGLSIEGSGSYVGGLKLVNTAASSTGAGGGIVAYSFDGAAMSSGDRLGYVLFGGGRNDTETRNSCGIAAFASENWVAASAAGSKLQFETMSDGTITRTAKLVIGSTGVTIGSIDALTRLTVEGTITLKEQAAADSDTAAYGQLWVKSDAPNTLWFTDDEGADTQLGGTLFTVKIDVGATAGYVGAGRGDGVLRAGTSLSYTDGGDFVTLNTIQAITTSSTPTFGGIVVANNGTIGQAAGPLLTFDDTNNYLEITGCNVGIGTTTPNQALDLIGSLKLEMTTTSTTGVIYKGTNRFIHNFQHPTGDTVAPRGHNTFVGEFAGNFIMGSTATESYHGSDNVIQGAYALYSNTTGYQNSAQGTYALHHNTTGYRNSAQGYYALYSNTIGYRNSAQGTYALYSNITGYQNSAQGIYALRYNTTGYCNSAQGYCAGGYIADGSTRNLTGNNSVFLGYCTRANADGETNQIVIGTIAIGAGSNSVVLGNNGIVKTLLKGDVAIGTPIPRTRLTVEGTITLKEQAAAAADTASYGQIWVKSNNPNVPMFTNDVGADSYVVISDAGTGGADSAGVGKQYVEIEIGGNVYKILHDGTV